METNEKLKRAIEFIEKMNVLLDKVDTHLWINKHTDDYNAARKTVEELNQFISNKEAENFIISLKS